jgi:hypothetical protein
MVKALEIVHLGGAISALLSFCVLEFFKKFGLDDRATAVSADNTNTNVGGKERKE